MSKERTIAVSCCLSDIPTPAGRWGPGFYEVIAFPLASGLHEALLVPSKSGVSILQSPWSSCNQAMLVFKAEYSGGFSSWCQTSRLGSLTWASETTLLWGNLCDIIIFQFVGHPPGVCRILYRHECPPPIMLLWFLFLSFGCRISSLVVSVFLLHGCSAVICDFGIFMREAELKASYFTILSLTCLPFLLK